MNFNRTFALDRGFPSYDAASQQAKLISEVVGNPPTKIIFPANGSGADASTSHRFCLAVDRE